MMQVLVYSQATRSQQPPLRAVVELIDGELKIFPIAETDEQAKKILDALRFVGKDDEASGR
jgi:hypothetical protein